jgi:hypothetical protein
MGDVENGSALGLPLTRRSRVRQTHKDTYTTVCLDMMYVFTVNAGDWLSKDTQDGEVKGCGALRKQQHNAVWWGWEIVSCLKWRVLLKYLQVINHSMTGCWCSLQLLTITQREIKMLTSHGHSVMSCTIRFLTHHCGTVLSICLIPSRSRTFPWNLQYPGQRKMIRQVTCTTTTMTPYYSIHLTTDSTSQFTMYSMTAWLGSPL